MLTQANDFFDESENLYNILHNLSRKDFEIETQFKKWTFNDIIRHLHVWNYASNISLKNENKWEDFYSHFKIFLKRGKSIREFEKNFIGSIKDFKLLELWRKYYFKIRDDYISENPKKRVKWVGPDMSIISSISARHMETWAHGQAVFDVLGIDRKNKDNILNIVIIGNNTFNWTYIINGLKPPLKVPHLKLISPSGKQWEFNNADSNNYISGMAEDFCKVVTQVRSYQDVNLKVVGKTAMKWMSIAQCFAGGPNSPPNPGSRKIISKTK